jgi:hypothetical protein
MTFAAGVGGATGEDEGAAAQGDAAAIDAENRQLLATMSPQQVMAVAAALL